MKKIHVEYLMMASSGKSDSPILGNGSEYFVCHTWDHSTLLSIRAKILADIREKLALQGIDPNTLGDVHCNFTVFDE